VHPQHAASGASDRTVFHEELRALTQQYEMISSDDFAAQTTLTDIMPMSDEAPGSPRGDGRWSGWRWRSFGSQ
jgi:hypothetical protein